MSVGWKPQACSLTASRLPARARCSPRCLPPPPPPSPVAPAFCLPSSSHTLLPFIFRAHPSRLCEGAPATPHKWVPGSPFSLLQTRPQAGCVAHPPPLFPKAPEPKKPLPLQPAAIHPSIWSFQGLAPWDTCLFLLRSCGHASREV